MILDHIRIDNGVPVPGRYAINIQLFRRFHHYLVTVFSGLAPTAPLALIC